MLPIYLFQQYYIPKHKTRKEEIIFCLKCNLTNKYIDKIILLNERKYTYGEMGLNSKYKSIADKKIIQIIISKRLTYLKAFQMMETFNTSNKNKPAYYILSNSDMFYNYSLNTLPKIINLHKKHSICLGRYEYTRNTKSLRLCPVSHITKAGGSQDTWIFYSAHMPTLNERFSKQLSFQLGQIRCDNRIAYILKDMGLSPINPMKQLKSYHLHTSAYRTYNRNNAIPGAILTVKPIL